MNNVKTWTIDPAHSEILFKVRHLMITNVKGEFRNFDAQIQSNGDDFGEAKVQATIKTDSIFTNNNDRDQHLKSADFFDAAQHPEITFEGTAFEKLDAENYRLKGNLNMHGVAKEISLDVEFGGITKDPYGQTKAGFSFSGKLNRSDFNLTWNAALETGGVMVSEEVKVNGELQFVLQA